MTDVERFAQLFEGNPSCYGAYFGAYTEGDPPWGRHLDGTEPIGIYPIWDGNVHWGCVDIDVPDLVHVLNLQRALQALGIYSVAELSKGKGYHVWVFMHPGGWTAARIMRRALLVACDISGAPSKEVNPKQEHVEGVGNYVRLPYPNRGAGGRQVFGRVTTYDPEGYPSFLPFNFNDGLDHAEARLNMHDPLHDAAELWTPPKREHVTPIGLDMRDHIERGLPWHVKERLKTLPLTRCLMECGPEDGDRSTALVHLAHLAAEARFDPSETLAILIEADLRWAHKYIERDHSDRELRRIVERVWA